MKSSISVLWAASFLFSAAVIASEATERHGPLYLKTAEQTSPVWISANDAVVNGRIQIDQFDDYAKQMLSFDLDMVRPGWNEERKLPLKSAAADLSECSTWITSPSSGANASLEEIADQSRFALTGTIRSQDQGFFKGRASSLFEVEVDEVLKAPSEAPLGPRVFFVYSTSRIVLGEGALCRRSSHYPAAPAIGKKVLVFANIVLETAQSVLVPSEQTLAFENADGTAVFSGSSQNLLDPPKWRFIARKIDELKRYLEQHKETAPTAEGAR